MTEEKNPQEVQTQEQIPAWAAGLMEQVAKLTEENAMLKEMAGKNAIASFIEGKKDHTARKVHFKKLDEGKVIVGWERLDDSQFVFDAKNPLKEGFKMTVVYKDSGAKEVIDYPRFVRCSDVEEAELLSFDPFGTSRVKFADGSELKVESKFLNA